MSAVGDKMVPSSRQINQTHLLKPLHGSRLFCLHMPIACGPSRRFSFRSCVPGASFDSLPHSLWALVVLGNPKRHFRLCRWWCSLMNEPHDSVMTPTSLTGIRQHASLTPVNGAQFAEIGCVLQSTFQLQRLLRCRYPSDTCLIAVGVRTSEG